MKRFGMLAVVVCVFSIAYGESYDWPSDTSGGLTFKDGKTYVVTTTSGAITNNSGTILVTNATLDAWSADANRVAYVNKDSSSVLTLEKDAVMRVFSLKNHGILNLKPGSRLELESFDCEKCGSGSQINADGGLIVFRNVSKPSTYYWFKNYAWNYPIISVLAGGLVISNAVSCSPRGYMPPVVSGVANDGGVTYKGSGTVYATINKKNAYTGGTHFHGSITYAITRDDDFGGVPSVPSSNIYWKSSGCTLYANAANIALHQNRDIVLSPNVTFNASSQSASGTLRIKGRIVGDGANCASTTLHATDNWSGSLTLSPGAGRTNQVGKLKVPGRLIHESGTTVLCGSETPITLASGLSAYSTSKGVIDITGGEIICNGSGVGALKISSYSQLRIDGGSFAYPSSIYHGYGSPSRTVVRNGLLKCYDFLLTHTTTTVANGDEPTALVLSTNGVLQCKNLRVGNVSHVGRVDFDGGTLRGTANWGSCFGESTWKKVTAHVHEGGATFDSNGYNIGAYLTLQSAAAKDGGLTKKGLGTFTSYTNNTYNGATRVLAGTLAFSRADGFPGGDVEIEASMLAARAANAPCITIPSVTFRSGAKIRLLVPTGYDLKNFKRYRPIVTAAAAFTGTLPSAEAVDVTTGTVLPTPVRLRLSADGKTISAKPMTSGFALLVR